MPFIHSVCSRSSVAKAGSASCRILPRPAPPCAPPGPPRRSSRPRFCAHVPSSPASDTPVSRPSARCSCVARTPNSNRTPRPSRYVRQGVIQASCVGPFSRRSTCVPGRAWSIQICIPMPPVVRVLARRGHMATSERTAMSQKYLRNSRRAPVRLDELPPRGVFVLLESPFLAGGQQREEQLAGEQHVLARQVDVAAYQPYGPGPTRRAGRSESGSAHPPVARRSAPGACARWRPGCRRRRSGCRQTGCAAWCPAGGGRRTGRSGSRARPAGRGDRRVRCPGRRCCAPCRRWCACVRRPSPGNRVRRARAQRSVQQHRHQ